MEEVTWQEVIEIFVAHSISFKGQQPRIGQFSDFYFTLSKQDENLAGLTSKKVFIKS